MTAPLTPEALVEARELVRQSLKGGAPGLTEATREAIVGSIMLKLTNKVLAPLLAALQQVTAERDEADRRAGAAERNAESDREDARKRSSWLHQAKRQAGYSTGVSFDKVWAETLEKAARADTATAEAARLRAEVEALKGALEQTKAAADDLAPVCIAEGDNKAAGALQFISGFVSDRLAAIEDTALARAATAREG